MNQKLKRLLQSLCIVISATAYLTSCGPKTLDPNGKVHLWAPEELEMIYTIADAQDGLSLTVITGGESWFSRLKKQDDSLDLVYTAWTHDVSAGHNAGLLLDITPYLDRIPLVTEVSAAFSTRFLTKAYPQLLLPAAAYTWGLFYNTEVLASHGVEIPASWDDLIDTFELLQSKGTVPIALGSSLGWPALAWISYLDLRLNGGTKHSQLFDGTRSFDDHSIQSVYRMLEEWREKEYFNADASKIGWPASLDLVRSGQAAYVLMGAFGSTRITNRDNVAFIRIPAADNDGDSGELAYIEGFSVAKTARAPEAALSLAEKYISAGVMRHTKNEYLIPLLKPGEKHVDQGESIAAVQFEILNSADILVPQIDQYVSAQTAYDVNRVLARFFDPKIGMSAEDLARLLGKILL